MTPGLGPQLSSKFEDIFVSLGSELGHLIHSLVLLSILDSFSVLHVEKLTQRRVLANQSEKFYAMYYVNCQVVARSTLVCQEAIHDVFITRPHQQLAIYQARRIH